MQVWIIVYLSESKVNIFHQRKKKANLFISKTACKVYLAMEAGYTEKVDELCDKYSLEGFLSDKGMP